MIKLLTSAVKTFICAIVLLFFTALNAHASSIAHLPKADTTDTARITTRTINRNFDDIFKQNLRPSFLGNEYFQPEKTMLVGDINAHFILFDTPASRFFFDVAARIKVRLLSEYGAPVKSPSYMPGGTLYFRANRDIYKPQFLSLSYTHHSNGIRGPTLKADGSFNRDSGKFSTNFYSLNYTIGKRTDKENIIINRFATAGIEVHAGLFGVGVAEGLTDHYGFVRLNGSYLFNIAKKYADPIDPGKTEKVFDNWQRIQFDVSYIADKYNDYDAFNLKKRLNIGLKYYYQLPFMQNASVVVGGGYRGQDDYNIFFEDSYGYVTIGIASGFSFIFNKN
ncbi:hypothetical protein [Mucilaginibacter segetis]|uniref:Uncharacterized protein n=1 Tax=Mucilaginibacter segetis TaxID=2793071 RepID=A0A934PTS1_9SPHI|nr:hypothetical protein [Mucilaginibacter segetis]MBK0379889.1 hypothetical protein [Mucilaginibacter segetis]